MLKDYADEWARSHDGSLPTVDQLTATGDVGAAHAWWPSNPWEFVPLPPDSGPGQLEPMAPGTSAGRFEYAPNQDGTFTVTVHLTPTESFPATYTAQ